MKLPGQSTGRRCGPAGCFLIMMMMIVIVVMVRPSSMIFRSWVWSSTLLLDYDDDDRDCGDDKTKFHDFQVKARVVGVVQRGAS